MSGYSKTVRDFPLTSEKVIILLCAFIIHTKQSVAVKTRTLHCKHSPDQNYGCLTLITEMLKEDLKQLSGE